MRFRCPVCQTIMWSARAMCAGGVPIYDPQAPPGARQPDHDPVLGIPDGDDPAPHRDRQPFEARHLPYVLRARSNGSLSMLFGPFPDSEAARRFADENRLFAYAIDTVFPPADVVGLRQ